MADESKRTEQKVRAIREAEFRLKQRLEAIDWRHDELYPELEALKLKGLQGADSDATIASIEAAN